MSRTGFAVLWYQVIAAVAVITADTASAQQANRPVPLTDPASWVTADDYPPDALRALSQGTVAVVLDVDTAGSVTACAVTASSGSASLDAQACRLFHLRARFEPIASGSIIRHYATRLRWTLPIARDPPAEPAQASLAPVEIASSTQIGDGGAELYVGSDGIVTGCQPIGRTYKNIPGPPDICGSYPVGARYGPPTTRHGRPSRRRVRIRVTIESTPLAGA